MTNQTICNVAPCDKPARHLGMCRAHYRRFNRHGDPRAGGPAHYKTPEEAFAARTARNRETGCLEWFGSSDAKGYGQLRINGKIVKAHRFAWSMVNGEIPHGMLILHSCDNPRCVNPDHLRAGTFSENMADMDARGRRVNAQLRGEKCPAAKLTEDQVVEIRKDTRTQMQIAKAYGISQAVVSKIKLYQAWGHVK